MVQGASVQAASSLAVSPSNAMDIVPFDQQAQGGYSGLFAFSANDMHMNQATEHLRALGPDPTSLAMCSATLAGHKGISP